MEVVVFPASVVSFAETSTRRFNRLPGGAMKQDEPFRFLRREEFEKLTVAEKIVYIDRATTELRNRGEQLRSFTQLVPGWPCPSERHRVRSRLAGRE
jgi:hypothetical protein